MITFPFGCHCQSENIFGSHSGNLKANRNFFTFVFFFVIATIQSFILVVCFGKSIRVGSGATAGSVESDGDGG